MSSLPPFEMWREIQDRFEPSWPVPVERPDWFAERSYDPIERIQQRLSLPVKDPASVRFLYMGTVGTGKSSELRRLALLQAERDFVVILDLVDHFERVVGDAALVQGISAWEVCFLTGLMLYQAAQDRLSLSFSENVLRDLESAWQEASKASGGEPAPAKLELGKLAKVALTGAGMALGGPAAGLFADTALKAADKAADAINWTLPMGKAQRPLPGDSVPSRKLLVAVNSIISELQLRHGRVVVIIDGLDRVRSEARVRELFVDTDMLARLYCPIVLCGPFVLRHNADIQGVRGFDITVHANEPVLRQSNPKEVGNGVAFFRELFRNRVRDIQAEAAIPDELLFRLAYYAGGRARDFVRLIRVLAEDAMALQFARKGPKQTPAQADRDLVDKAIDAERRKLEIGLHKGHLELLREVMDDPLHRLPNSPLTEELLQTGWLLPYPNEAEWFYPHPLLTLRQLP